MQLTKSPLQILSDKIRRLKTTNQAKKTALKVVLSLIEEHPVSGEMGSAYSLLEYENIVLEKLLNTNPKEETFIFNNQKQKQMTEVQNDDFQIVIEDVPLDTIGRPTHETSKYWPYVDRLQVGQSFSFPASDHTKLANMVSYLKIKYPDRKFGIRTISETHKRFGRKA